jgi:putative tricarboxylic transport membrane protein
VHFYAMASHLSAFMKAKIQGEFEDYVPVAMFMDESNVYAINAEAPYKDLKGLVAYAKKNPKKITAGFGSIGGTGHLLAYMLAKQAGVEFNYLAHKSGGEAVIGLLAGRIQLVPENPSEMLQHVKAGKLKIIGDPSEKRHPDMPDVPTLRELGYDVVFGSARGVVAFKPSDEVRSYWAGVFKKVFENEKFQNFMKENMMAPNYKTGPELVRFFNDKYKLVRPIAEEMGLVTK